MSNYIAWYGKKRAHLADHERKFSKLLQTTTDTTRLSAGAELVRAAHIRVLKATAAQLAPMERNADAVANLAIKVQFWLDLPAQELIDGYRSGKLRGPRLTQARRTRSR